MVYLRIGLAAIKRHRLESPYRMKYNDLGLRQGIPFGLVLKILSDRKKISKTERNHVHKKYKKLSKILHSVA